MAPKPKKRIILLYADPRIVDTHLTSIPGSAIDYWAYLGTNISTFIKVEKIIGHISSRIAIGDALQDTARTCRQPYIDYMGMLAKEAGSWLWYLTSLSEKNPYISLFFLHFCYLRTALKLIQSYNGTICLMCESRPLIFALKVCIEGHPELHARCEISLENGTPDRLRMALTQVINKSVFLFRFVGRILMARGVSIVRCYQVKNKFTSADIAIHSWADWRSFINKGSYRDEYFGALGDIIRKTNRDFFFIITVLPTFFFPTAVKKLFGSDIRWKLFEEFLNLSDLLESFLQASRARKLTIRSKTLIGIDVSHLIIEELERDSVSSRMEYTYLWYRAAKKVCQEHSISTFMYTFENHTWEKMCLFGLRESCSNVKAVGYAHATVNSMELYYGISAFEKDLIPLPDCIAVNGSGAKKALIDAGFGNNIIKIAGSLRFSRYYKKKDMGQKATVKRVLVILSANFEKSAEMVIKCIKAFEKQVDFSIIFKPHPTSNATKFRNIVQFAPRHFSFSFKPMSIILTECDLAIYSDSTGAVEALACDIPVLHIKSDFFIDINPLERYDSIPSVNTPNDILTKTIQLLKDADAVSGSFQNVVEELFAPIDEDLVKTQILEI